MTGPGEITPVEGIIPNGGTPIGRLAGFVGIDSLAVDAEGNVCLATLVGGARVLALGGVRAVSRVGDANTNAVQEVLAEAGVCVRAHDLGGSLGRSVWFDPRDGGQIRVRAIGSADRYLEQHRSILTAIEKQDSGEAARAMREHLKTIEQRLLAEVD